MINTKFYKDLVLCDPDFLQGKETLNSTELRIYHISLVCYLLSRMVKDLDPIYYVFINDVIDDMIEKGITTINDRTVEVSKIYKHIEHNSSKEAKTIKKLFNKRIDNYLMLMG